MIKLENVGLRAPLKISLGSGLHSQKGIRAPVSKNDRATGSTAEISGLQGSRDPPFGTLNDDDDDDDRRKKLYLFHIISKDTHIEKRN